MLRSAFIAIRRSNRDALAMSSAMMAELTRDLAAASCYCGGLADWINQVAGHALWSLITLLCCLMC